VVLATQTPLTIVLPGPQLKASCDSDPWLRQPDDIVQLFLDFD